MRRVFTFFLVIPLLGAVAAPASAQSSTEPPMTSVRTDILPGVALTVKEVRPGIFRVLGDGIRDLDEDILDITVDANGNVWVERGSSRDWRIVRLGQAGVSRHLKRQNGWDLDVTVDGMPIISSGSGDRVFDGDAWVKMPPGDAWVEMPPETAPGEGQGPCAEADAGFAVGGACWATYVGLLRWVDGDWQDVPSAEVGVPDSLQTGWYAAAGDGTGWVAWAENSDDDWWLSGLLGYDEDGWTEWIPYEPTDGVDVEPGGPAVVAPDGTVWFWGRLEGGTIAVSWDGEAWARYGPMDMSGSVDEMVFAPDGTAWMTTYLGFYEDDQFGGWLYVIIPEAVE